MLRMLTQMVDRSLELREPLSDRLDRWQRELIDPRRPFSNWTALLEARIELRRLENLSEGQYDALTELRDAYLEETPDLSVSDAYLVRLNDVMEHIQRVLHHARRLEPRPSGGAASPRRRTDQRDRPNAERDRGDFRPLR
jgi:Mg2+ and Co2+ transporter CorA